METTLGNVQSVLLAESPDMSVSDITKDDLNLQHINALAPYLAQAENLRNITPNTAPSLLASLSTGMRKAGDFLALAKYNATKARADRKRAEAIAALDSFPKYLKEQKLLGIDIKATDDTRKHYVAMHPSVLAAIEREAFFDAVQEQLWTMKQELFMSITTVRSIAYGFKDSNQLSAVATAADE